MIDSSYTRTLYYSLAVGVPSFEAPPSKSKEKYARAIRMIRDILHNEEPK